MLRQNSAAAAYGDVIAEGDSNPVLRIGVWPAAAEQVVGEGDAVADKAVFAGGDVFAQERVGLDAGAGADRAVALDLNKRPDEYAALQRAFVEVNRLNNCHVVSCNHIPDAGFEDFHKYLPWWVKWFLLDRSHSPTARVLLILSAKRRKETCEHTTF